MRKLGSGLTALAIAVFLTALAATSSGAASREATRAFDGVWSVSIYTESGPCDPSYRYPARIIGGQIRQADNDFSYQLSGVVASSGAIAVVVTKSGQSATGYGRLLGNRGGGRWSAQGVQCFGTWNAVRRG
jgi:hypothetical protein